MRIIISILFSILVFLIYPCCNSAEKAKLEVEIYAIDSITIGDEANIRLLFKNTGGQDLNIYWWRTRESVVSSINHFLFFSIINDNNDTLVYNYKGPVPKMPHERDIKTILPSGYYDETINLVEYYVPLEIVDSTSQDSQGRRKWPSGKYTIQCKYEYSHDPNWIGGENLWEGKVISNKISLGIK